MTFKVLKRKPYSNHPDDSHLQVVLTETGNSYTPFSTHLENSSVEEGRLPFLVEGHYCTDYESALADFQDRGKVKGH